MKNTESLFKFEDGKREHSDLVKCLACQAAQGNCLFVPIFNSVSWELHCDNLVLNCF